MPLVLLLFICFASHRLAPPATLATARGHSLPPTFSHQQSDSRLTLSQIEQLLNSKVEDEIIALEVRRQGIAYKLDQVTEDRLRKLGAGQQTLQAIKQQAARAAYTEFSREKNPAQRLALGKEFLRAYPSSAEAANVAAELRGIELALFKAAFQAFANQPGASGLEQVLMLGRQLLGQQPDRATTVQITARLALTTGRGMIGNFYNNLEQSRDYAQQALKLLEETTPPAGMDAPSYARLRAVSLGLVYQSLGLYQLRQATPDAEQAISFLTKAIAWKDGPSANDPITYWLRALARNQNWQKLSDEYRALSKEQRTGRPGQLLCGKIDELFNQLFADYTQVISLSGRADASQLKEEAVAALKQLVMDERLCVGGRADLIDEWPSEEKRAALVIGVEDYLDKSLGKFNAAASGARAFADALIKHGRFPKDQVALLATGEPGERQPLRSVILQQLAALPQRVKQDGLLLIYFAGREFEGAGRNYLLAADSYVNNEALLADTAINVERMKELIRASGAGQVVLIFDAFRQKPVSESFFRALSFDVRKNEVAAFALLLATNKEHPAHESAAQKQSFFTAALLEAARGRAASQKRGVTLADLRKQLETIVPAEVRRELGASVEQLPLIVTEGYAAEDLVMFVPDQSGPAAKPNPAELLRAAKTIHIRSKTIYLNPPVLEAELRKLPEFQALQLKLVGNANEADVVVEVTLPFLTWMWNYTVTHRATSTVLTTNKIRGLTDGSVSPRLAGDLVTRLRAARESTARPQ